MDRYKMSNILCGRSQSVIYADYTIDSSGYTFISGVIVDVITPKDDGTEAFQTLSINSQKFQQVKHFTFVCLFVCFVVVVVVV